MGWDSLIETEQQAQARIFKIAATMKAKYPDIKMLHPIPNGGKRDIIAAVQIKRAGGKKGVSDMFLASPKGGYHGFYIELKVQKRKPSKEQLEWIADTTKQGYLAECIDGADATIKRIEEYLDGKIRREG